MKLKIIFTVILLLIQSRVFSETSFFKTIRNQEFIGARPMSLGEAFLAVADDINAIFWNPAGLPSLDHLGVNSMRTNLYHSGVGGNYLALCIPGLPKSSIGIDWMNLAFEDDEFDFSKNKFNFSGGYQLFEWLNLGFNLKHIRMNASYNALSEGPFYGWGADWGVLIQPYSRLRCGLVVHDFTNTYLHGIEGALYRQNIRFGAAYFIKDNLLVASDFDDRFHLGTEWRIVNNMLALRTGIQKDFYTNENVTLSYGFGLDIPFWGQRLRLDYGFIDTPTLPNTHRTSLSFLIDLFPQLLKIQEVKLRPAYASLYKSYAENPLGEVYVNNEGKKDLDCSISVAIDKYAKELKKTIILPAKSVQRVPIRTVFSDSVLQELDNIPLTADIKISYTSGNRPKQIHESKIFHLFSRNSIDWREGVAQAAAFITPDDPVVGEFTRTALADFSEEDVELLNSEVFTKSIYLFNALAKHGVKYEEDRYSPYSKRYQAFDNIHYASQVLAEKQGDCDDLCVLFASVFENRNIPTALVSIPGHIFLLFNSGIHERHAFQICCAENKYVVDEQQIWIPLETTWLQKSFCDAWKKGAEILNEYPETEREIVKVRAAWERYEPIASTGKILKSTPQFALQDFSVERQTVQSEKKKHLAELEAQVARQPGDLPLRNKLAITYAYQNQPAVAKKHFRKILSQDSTHLQANNNLGNLFFEQGNLDSAQFYYQRALAQAKDRQQDGIQLNLGLLYAAADMESLAVDIFSQVMSDSTDHQRIGELLGIGFKNDDLVKGAELKPKKKVSKTRVKRITAKALKKKKQKRKKKAKIKRFVNLGGKGTQPKEEIENVFYWAF